MKSVNNIFKKLVIGIKKILWILGLHAFSIILLFVFIDFILGAGIFYKYVFLAENAEPIVTDNIIKFDVKTYQDVLKELNF